MHAYYIDLTTGARQNWQDIRLTKSGAFFRAPTIELPRTPVLPDGDTPGFIGAIGTAFAGMPDINATSAHISPQGYEIYYLGNDWSQCKFVSVAVVNPVTSLTPVGTFQAAVFCSATNPVANLNMIAPETLVNLPLLSGSSQQLISVGNGGTLAFAYIPLGPYLVISAINGTSGAGAPVSELFKTSVFLS